MNEKVKHQFHIGKAALALIGGLAVSMVGCGSQSSDDANSADAPVQSVSAEPAFIARSCDGEKSPNRFCPVTDQ